jgi:hypothetical protein
MREAMGSAAEVAAYALAENVEERKIGPSVARLRKTGRLRKKFKARFMKIS